MNVLNDRESLELFCQNAFKMNRPATNYEGLSNRAIRYAKGLPLALNVIGSNLIGKDLDEWKSALDKYERNPHKDIQSILRISYDSLDCNEKDIFLDIACFFNGQRLDYVKRILDGCEFFPEDGIRILIDKSLITVENGSLRMHDLIQEMGREIVKQEAPKEASERSRLWFREDILEVLKENIGSGKIEGIKLDYREEVKQIHATFEKMRKLRILIVQNTTFSSGPIYLPNQLRLLDWKGYPSQSFPPGFYPEKIAAFNLRCSAIVLDKPFEKFEHLTYMNFSYCQSITQFPDVSGATNLRELRLDRCKRLVKVDESVGFLPNLVYLSASGCSQLRSFLAKISLPSLEYLSFSLCRRLEHFPDIMGKMHKPLKINMRKTAIKELPRSFCNLIGLNHADMTSCKGLQDLPSNLFMLPNFVTLKIGGCSQLRESLRRFQGCKSIADWCLNLETLHISSASLSDEDLRVIIQSFPKLKDLNVSSNHFASFPACIQDSTCLTSLDVSYCVKLEDIPQLPSSVQKVDARLCNSLTAETSNMLWSQVRKEINRLDIVMPGTKIPEWFDYHEEGGIPKFWARGKLPNVAIAFVFEKVNYEGVGLQLLVDGKHVHGQRQKYLHNLSVAEDHLVLCDPRVLLSDEDWKGVDARFRHDDDWKCVIVKCETEMILRFWGVYVYKQETNMNDIQFTCPYSSTRHLAWTMDRNVEDQEPCETASRNELEVSSASGEEASCSGSDGSKPLTHTCSPFCISILSTLKKLICCNATTKTATTNAPPPPTPRLEKPKQPQPPPRAASEPLPQPPPLPPPPPRPKPKKPKEPRPPPRPAPKPLSLLPLPQSEKPKLPRPPPPRRAASEPLPPPPPPPPRPRPEKPKEPRPPPRAASEPLPPPPPRPEPGKPKQPRPPPQAASKPLLPPPPRPQAEKATPPPPPPPPPPLAALEPLPSRPKKPKEPEKPKPLRPEKPKQPEYLSWGRPELDVVGGPVGITSPEVEMQMQLPSFSGWGPPVDNTSLDFGKQMLLPSSSECLQTVVGNLKRIMAVSSDEEESESESEA